MVKGTDLEISLEMLLERHRKGILSGDDREKMHQLIGERYPYGAKIPGYICPTENCGRELVYTWAMGPMCIESEGGCGFSYNGKPTPTELINRVNIQITNGRTTV